MKQHFNCSIYNDVFFSWLLKSWQHYLYSYAKHFIWGCLDYALVCILSCRKSLILPRRALVNKDLPEAVAYIELLKKTWLKCWWDWNGETHTQWTFEIGMHTMRTGPLRIAKTNKLIESIVIVYRTPISYKWTWLPSVYFAFGTLILLLLVQVRMPGTSLWRFCRAFAF